MPNAHASLLMNKFILLLSLFTVLSVHAETPKEGATAICELIKAENYTELFPSRYSEWYKIENEGIAPEQAIAQLSRGYQKQHEMILDVYSQLADAKFEISERENPQKSETGKVATATVTIGDKQRPFKLYEMKNGLWGFHM
jgi:hypothetical protein